MSGGFHFSWNELEQPEVAFLSSQWFQGAWFHWKVISLEEFSVQKILFKADKSHFTSEIEYHENHV